MRASETGAAPRFRPPEHVGVTLGDKKPCCSLASGMVAYCDQIIVSPDPLRSRPDATHGSRPLWSPHRHALRRGPARSLASGLRGDLRADRADLRAAQPEGV